MFALSCPPCPGGFDGQSVPAGGAQQWLPGQRQASQQAEQPQASAGECQVARLGALHRHGGREGSYRSNLASLTVLQPCWSCGVQIATAQTWLVLQFYNPVGPVVYR